ncbi:MAG: M23 family metallopeptidase, partial [Hyphomicrobiales bacterium]
ILALMLMVAAGASAQAGGLPAFEIDGWQQFERQVRDDLISYEDGLKEIQHWRGVLPQAYPAEQFGVRVFFPLRDYGLKHVGGKNGEGYRPSRYQFVGPKHRIGHPAQDIFVYDGNQDSLDDRTGNPIEVLALADGVVVSTFSDWTPTRQEPGNGRRGGNYVWIYHPALGLFSYYAHLQTITAQLGERVAGGQAIATLGRTGTNAFLGRSPTHLHLMLLHATDMTPVDPYPWLKKTS